MNENDLYRRVLAEFESMKRAGMRVPQQAYALAYSENLSDYTSMSIGGIADLLIELAEVTT